MVVMFLFVFPLVCLEIAKGVGGLHQCIVNHTIKKKKKKCT